MKARVSGAIAAICLAVLLSIAGLLAPPAAQAAPKIAGGSPQRAAQIARGARMSCLSGQPCSASVGMVSLADGVMTRTCTGSLVASDVVLTNAHCVPPELRHQGAVCRGLVFMNFAPAKGFETQIDCAEILLSSTGENDDTKPDIAFFRLAHGSRRPVLPVSRKGIDDEQKFSVIKVDPTSTPGYARGVQSRVTCTSHMNAYLMKVYSSPFAINAQFGNCRIIHGNSGAPILADDGTVRGVIYGIVEPKAFVKFFKDRLMTFVPGAKLSTLAPATNLACMDVPSDFGLDPKPIDLCGAFAENTSRHDLDSRSSSLLQDIFTDLKQTHSDVARFKWTTNYSKGEIELVPTCALEPHIDLASADVGVITFKRNVQLDANTRLVKVEIVPVGSGSHLSLHRAGRDFAVRLDAKALTIPPCE